VFFVCLSHATFAQFNYVIDQSIPVSDQNNVVLSMPWAGGLNATQVNTLDLNGDGRQDLVVFDRTSDRVITFLNNNNQYQFAPEYETYFPAEITNWMLLRDYNGDGKKDIFTGDNLGIKVYTNITQAGGQLQWKQFLFTGVGSKSTVLLTKYSSGKINLQLNGDDLPSISDVDGDGDVDLFVTRYPTGSTIELHKNFSVERYASTDSLDFERTVAAWGGVTECDCGVFAFNGNPCAVGGRVEHAGGKGLLAMDIDHDGDQDMILSESECTQPYLLRNEGTNAAPVINTAISFPTGNPAFMPFYPAPFFEDVDFDGVKDLIVTPNLFAREFLQTNFRQSVWFYKNTGSTALPTFAAPIRNFLQRNMIDVGDNSVPAFFDADGDGDLDLFIACYTFNFSGAISYYENTGTQSFPAFKLITSDFHGIGSYNLINIKPTFADMNGDTKIDLVFTASGQFGNSQLFYFPNNNGIGVNFSQEIVATGFFISPTENICVSDVNRDGKNDLLVGKQNGALQYWGNTGTAASASYSLLDDSYLGLGPSVLRQNLACVTANLDGDGSADLVIGDQAGKLSIVSNYREASDAAGALTNIIYNPIQGKYISQNLGGRIWPTVANIFNSDRSAIVVGNTQGGIHILKPDESVQLSESPIIDIYPNPVPKATSVVTVKVNQPAAMIMSNALGQDVAPPVYFQAFQEYSFQLHPFAKGIYLMRFFIRNKSYTRKIIIN
jgi:hypothetical protein